MNRFVKTEERSFIGRDAFLEEMKTEPSEIFATFVVEGDGADCVGGEPIFLNNDYAGYMTSGRFGYFVGESLALGYLKYDLYQPDSKYEVEINSVLRPVSLSPEARFDPSGERMRS